MRLPAAVAAGVPVLLGFSTSAEAASSRGLYAGEDGAYISGEAATWYPLPAGSRRATGTTRFVVPAGFTVASTGRQRATTQTGTFEFDIADPTTVSFAAGRHTVHRLPGRPAIALHLLTARPRVTERLQTIRRILTALEAEFGAYPHPDLEIVEMPDTPAGSAYAGTSLEGFVVTGREDFLAAVDTVYAALPERDRPDHRFMLDAVRYYEAFKVGDYATARPLLERALSVPPP